MRRARISIVEETGERDVLIEYDDDATVADLSEPLRPTGSAAASSLWLHGRELPPERRLLAASLHDGARLHRGGPGKTPPPEPPPAGGAGLLLDVLTGPAAGGTIALPDTGAVVLGRQLPGLGSEEVSRRHARLECTEGFVTVTDLGSTNGTRLNGTGAADGRPARPGDVITVGEVRLQVGCLPTGPGPPLRPDDNGGLTCAPAPRLPEPAVDPHLIVPSPPPRRDARRFPVLPVLAPAVVGGLLAITLRQPTFILFAAMSPVLALASATSERRHRRRQQALDEAAHATATTEHDAAVRAALRRERQRRHLAAPPVAAAIRSCRRPDQGLWTRRRIDDDAGIIRLGTAVLPARLTVSPGGSGNRTHPQLPDAPVTVTLSAGGMVGLAGPRSTVDGLARSILLQLATHLPPGELSITVLCPGRPGLGSARWLPHATGADGRSPAVAVTLPSAARPIGDIGAALSVGSNRAAAPSASTAAGPLHVLVTDHSAMPSPERAAALPAAGAHGWSLLSLAEDEAALPAECSAIVQIRPDGSGQLRRRGEAPIDDIALEPLAEKAFDEAARCLAPLRPPAAPGAVSVPDEVRLIDLLDLARPTAEAVAARWLATGAGLAAVVGRSAGRDVRLDLVADGPHGLVAGTTGSGKSELLQAIVASLAASHPPDALAFVLVDYKGGSAFRECAQLPHVAGLVTDLDEHLVTRALTSLTAELRRREQVLAASASRDITEHTGRRRCGEPLPALARLIVVVDEFATLARELPGFVSGLVGLSQRGRALGIHLLLATQRPGGVVSPEIRANVNLRIALRTTDGSDSADVIGQPDAARIAPNTPGRGFLRVGPGRATEFQTGRITGTTAAEGVRPRVIVGPLEDATVVAEAATAVTPPTAAIGRRPSDLAELVSAIRGAAGRRSEAAQPPPWLPPLPAVLSGADLPTLAAGSAAFGLSDLPAEQRRAALCFELDHDGHLLVVGSPGSGRSTTLLSLASALTRTTPADRLHLHALDFGSGALEPLAVLPHCGTIARRHQPMQAMRLLERLVTELEHRLARPHPPRPHLLVLLDAWEGFMATLAELEGGRPAEQVVRLVREGQSAGIHLAIAGDRSLASHRIAGLIDRRLALRLVDRTDYSLLGLAGRDLPVRISPGRAFSAGSGIESQIARLDVADLRSGHAAVSRAAPWRIRALPERVTHRELWAARGRPTENLTAWIGIGGDEAAGVGPDLATGSTFVVAGPPRSGRSTVVATLATSVLRQGAGVVAAAIRPTRLGDIAQRSSSPLIVDPGQGPAEWLEAVRTAAESATGRRRVVIVIDDGEAFRDTPAAPFLAAVARGEIDRCAIVLGGDVDLICTGLTGWQLDVQRGRRGLLLSPRSLTDGGLIGATLPRLAISPRGVQPGHGWLHLGDGEVVPVSLPADVPGISPAVPDLVAAGTIES
jgi:S-DNA-T family DNA segregation ATPase FtsK/SpoIIIE